MPVYHPDLDTSAVILPGPPALRAGARDLLVPPIPEAAIGQLEHVIDANRGPALVVARNMSLASSRTFPIAVHGTNSHPLSRRLPAEMPSERCRDT